jgi:hypothetical protein
MAKTMKNCNGAQGASTATQTERNTVSVPEISLLLRDLCTARCAIDEFYDSEDGQLMQDAPDSYFKADVCLAKAISHLGEYVGMYQIDEFLRLY